MAISRNTAIAVDVTTIAEPTDDRHKNCPGLTLSRQTARPAMPSSARFRTRAHGPTILDDAPKHPQVTRNPRRRIQMTHELKTTSSPADASVAAKIEPGDPQTTQIPAASSITGMTTASVVTRATGTWLRRKAAAKSSG